jgi:alpha-1,6-mannosyltransferase
VFLMCVTLAEPVDGSGGAVDQIPARVASIAAIVVVGVYVLVGYSDEEDVDARRLVGAVPFGSAILQRLSGGRLGGAALGAPALRVPARK